ncbi:MAG: alpha-hydroxy-acid oxidizing protein [Vulcanimicrobiota bacterium]
MPTDLGALERLAARAMGDTGYSYVAGGAGLETTMAANRRAFEQVAIVPRMLRDVSRRNMRRQVFGGTVPAPFFLAPVGVLELAHRQADRAAARAAAGLGIPMIFSNQASTPMEECAALMGCPRWFQLYPSQSDELIKSLVARAENCGCSAIVVTLDTTMLGWRVRDLDRASLPFLQGKGIAQYTSDPVFQALVEDSEAEPPAGPITLSSLALLVQQSHRLPGGLLDNLRSRRALRAVRKFIEIYTRASLNWDDLSRLREMTRLPLVLKGILAADDARQALEVGVDGIYVSNHGGRQVDGALASLMALAEVASAVDGRVPIFFDSGIRGGADIFKALALGATAVGLGRPFVYALAVAGEAGVRELLENFQADFELTMALAGCASLDQIDRSALAL